MNFECHLCSYTTDSIPLLHVHCINAHPREFFTCPWCTIPFGSLRTLQKHTKNCPQFNTNEVNIRTWLNEHMTPDCEILNFVCFSFNFISRAKEKSIMCCWSTTNVWCARVGLFHPKRQSNTTKSSIWTTATSAMSAKCISNTIPIWMSTTQSLIGCHHRIKSTAECPLRLHQFQLRPAKTKELRWREPSSGMDQWRLNVKPWNFWGTSIAVFVRSISQPSTRLLGTSKSNTTP